MKKYKVTSKHPVYKEGLVYKEDEDGEFDLLPDQKNPYVAWETIDKAMIKGHTSEGWIEEIQEPLFTTEDGKDIYINDTVWFAENDNAFSTKARKHEKFHDTLDILKKCKAFSTEDAAKKYIDQNKLKFSEVDMIEFTEWCDGIYPYRKGSPKFRHDDIFQWQLKINKHLDK